jgi:hypothetical protein
LHADGIVTADADVSHHADSRLTALVVIEVGAVTEKGRAGHRASMKNRASVFRNQEGSLP